MRAVAWTRLKQAQSATAFVNDRHSFLAQSDIAALLKRMLGELLGVHSFLMVELTHRSLFYFDLPIGWFDWSTYAHDAFDFIIVSVKPECWLVVYEETRACLIVQSRTACCSEVSCHVWWDL